MDTQGFLDDLQQPVQPCYTNIFCSDNKYTDSKDLINKIPFAKTTPIIK